MAVQAFFNSGVLTVHSGNATPDVPEYADDAVGDPGAPMESANNLKQIAIAIHALDAGECSVDICGQNSPSASPEPVTHAGWGPLGGRIKRSWFVRSKHWIREPLVFSDRFCRRGRWKPIVRRKPGHALRGCQRARPKGRMDRRCDL